MHKVRTLAIEVRISYLGFVVLEGSNRLLDWGTRRCHSDTSPAKSAMGHIDPLLAFYSPSVVVLKNMNRSRRADRRRIILAVKHKLAERYIEVHMVKRSDVRQTFCSSGNRNKYEIAVAIAKRFPQLQWKLPPKKRPWQPERLRTAIFDAVALGMACWEQCEPATAQSHDG